MFEGSKIATGRLTPKTDDDDYDDVADADDEDVSFQPKVARCTPRVFGRKIAWVGTMSIRMIYCGESLRLIAQTETESHAEPTVRPPSFPPLPPHATAMDV